MKEYNKFFKKINILFNIIIFISFLLIIYTGLILFNIYAKNNLEIYNNFKNDLIPIIILFFIFILALPAFCFYHKNTFKKNIVNIKNITNIKSIFYFVFGFFILKITFYISKTLLIYQNKGFFIINESAPVLIFDFIIFPLLLIYLYFIVKFKKN